MDQKTRLRYLRASLVHSGVLPRHARPLAESMLNSTDPDAQYKADELIVNTMRAHGVPLDDALSDVFSAPGADDGAEPAGDSGAAGESP